MFLVHITQTIDFILERIKRLADREVHRPSDPSHQGS